MRTFAIQGKRAVLGIETSCDDTCAAIVLEDGTIVHSAQKSQHQENQQKGGVVPSLAAQNHRHNLPIVVEDVLQHAPVDSLDAVALTIGPGLAPCLGAGLDFCKQFCSEFHKPLIPVHHMEAHAMVPTRTSCLFYPSLSFLISGGHTQLLYCSDHLHPFLEVGSSLDDACGEAFDKVARTLGLPYPGGVHIDRLAKEGQDNITFKSVVMKDGNFSYSGLKTGVINYLHNKSQIGEEVNQNDVAKSFTVAAVKGVVDEAVKIASQKYKKLCVAGGVGANSFLREYASQQCRKQGINLFLPELKYCGDNAAMIASQGYFLMREGVDFADMTLNACPTLSLKQNKEEDTNE